MAQALMAVVMQKPGTARARPSSLLKKDDDYEKVFNETFPIEVFRASIEIVRLAESHLRTDMTLLAEDRFNLKFYVAMYIAALATRKPSPTPKDIVTLAGVSIDTKFVTKAAETAIKVYFDLGGTAVAAKGKVMGDKLLAKLAAGI